MPEENTTDNQASIAPELSESPELEDGELADNDLEAAAGGFAPRIGGDGMPDKTPSPVKPPSLSSDIRKLFEGP